MSASQLESFTPGARRYVLRIGHRHRPGPVRAPRGGIRARRVTEEVVRATFTTGRRTGAIEPAAVENNRDGEGAPGWFATVTRV